MILCFLCPKISARVEFYLKHIRNAHHGLRRNSFLCMKCKSKFSCIYNYDKHIKKCYKFSTVPLSHIPESSSIDKSDQLSICSSFSKNSESSFSSGKTAFDVNHDVLKNLNSNIRNNTEFEKSIFNSALKFSLNLHSKPNLCRQNVFDIQESVGKLTSEILNLVKEKLRENCNLPPSEYNEIFNTISDPFCFIKSEHLLLKELKKLNLMQDFTEFPINEEVGVVFQTDGNRLEKIVHKGVIMPIEFQIEQFIKKNNILKEMIKNRDKYINEKSDEIKHFVQCRTWEKIVSKVETNDNTILLPIGLYSDGMQYNNPLGAHSESSEMLHYFFPCLDDPLNESNTFLASIVMSKDVKSYGNGSCFSPLIDVFNKLFTKGISVEIDGSIKTIKFLLGNITGDNLAMNAILDYVISFNSNIFCRFCICNSKETVSLCREVPDKLRTEENYSEGVKKNNPKLSGICVDCVFNLLPYFHCVDNKSSDIMHDYFEGICRCTFSKLILYLNDKKILSIDEFNKRITDFCYGKEEIKYIPKIFEKLKLLKSNMKTTAKEMWQFCYLLPAIIGDVIPPNDEMWEMCLNLIQAIDLLLGSKFRPETIDEIENKIERHNILYKQNCGNLTPKMHMATHIGTSIKYMGPPRHYMCFRLEEKHRFFKIYAHVINCRKNMPVSFAMKYSIFFSNYLINHKKEGDITYDKRHKITTQFPNIVSEDSVCYSKIKFRGSEVNSGMFVPYNNKLLLIKEVSVLNNKILLLCKIVGNLTFFEHLDSYILNRLESSEEPFLINYDAINSQPLNIYKTFDGKEIVRFKNYF